MSEAKVLKKGNHGNNNKPADIAELLNSVTFTVDPGLDNIESKKSLSAKAEKAKKIFSNYRKAQV